MSVNTKFGPVNSAASIGAWLNQCGFGGSPEGALMMLNALEVNRVNQTVQDTLNNIKASARLRQAINQRLNKINELKALIRKEGEGSPKSISNEELCQRLCGLRDKPMPPLKPRDPGPTASKTKRDEFEQEKQQWENNTRRGSGSPYDRDLARWEAEFDAAKEKLCQDYCLTKDAIAIDANTGRMTATPGGPIMTDNVCLEDLEVEDTRLSGMRDTCDQDRQLQLTQIQTALNKKQQLITLLTNMIKKSHETKSAVLRNLA